ncbi:hypothetical protein EIN_153150 [Entamoeba invadens IP1]|uniref:Ubiquitin-like domain-containing protein n=1 Tax=Entamoeba invadens IP1 TaxID=370355 RepID=A0A0A1UC80_ENTIV|nr:hypothetical protein EIN_153150 [Entamoeba invadens IP1]ELP91308.1 hypothetical protein EIN_153150 [Entamoeba invadens IP1]|eukprot:XP_004258079.1 hypothetical protein EIN_153150 [Entamoeba invadens IP1]
MPLLTLKNNRHSPVLIDFEVNDKIKTIKKQIAPKGMTDMSNIVLFYNETELNEEKTFKEMDIKGGSIVVYLIKNDITKEADKLIQMLNKGIKFHKAKNYLQKTNGNVKDALTLAKNEKDETDDDSSTYSDDESTSEFVPPQSQHPPTFSQVDSSQDYAEEVLSENFKSGESGLNN